MLNDVKNTLSIVAQILQNDVLPYFDIHKELSASDISAITAQFLTVQTALIQCDQTLESTVLAVEQKIADFNSSSGSSASVTGTHKNLKVSSTGLDANVTVTCDELIVSSSNALYKTIKNVNLTFNTLDTGSIVASTWYAVHIAYNGTTAIGILSLSATAPTLPTDYTFFTRVGWIRTDATANKYPFSFIQFGNKVQYKLASGSNLTTQRLMASGSLGSAGTPTWSAVSVVAFVPPTARSITLLARAFASGILGIAPSSLYGAYNSTSNPPPFCLNSSTNSEVFDLVLESTNIYCYSNVSQSIFCFGWEDSF